MSEAQPPPLTFDQPVSQNRWKWRCFVLTVLYVGALMFFGYISLRFSVRFEKIFEEMLGDRAKLPAYTKLVIGVSRFMQGNVLFVGPLLLFVMPILLWVFRGNKTVSIIMLLLIVLMVAWSVCAIVGLTAPLGEMIESINREG